MSYEDAWAEQRRLHTQRVADEIPDTLLLLEHQPVYTAGKRTQDWERPSNGTPVVDVDRGGRITWHGPGQVVGYPILRLPEPIDVVAYVRALERMLIDVCAEFGVTAQRIDEPGYSGAWLPADDRGPNRKIGAIGLRVSRSVTMHGFALNCNPDMSAYDPIVACGIEDAGNTSLSRELGRSVTVAEALPRVERHMRALVASFDARSAAPA